MDDLKQTLGRTLNINHEIRGRYEQLEQMPLFRDHDRRAIFMLCLALGVKIKKRKKVENGVGLLNVSMFSPEDVWMMASIAVKENDGDLSTLSKPIEIRKIASEYAHGGLDELERIIDDYGAGEEFELFIESKMKDAKKSPRKP